MEGTNNEGLDEMGFEIIKDDISTENNDQNQNLDDLNNDKGYSEKKDPDTPNDIKDIKEPNNNQELSEDSVREYLKSKHNLEIESIEDFIKPKESTTTNVNPYEDVMDDSDKAYFDYKKETGRGRKEFEFLNQDVSKLDSLTLSRKIIQQESNSKLTEEQIDTILEKKLDIDLDEVEDDATTRYELDKFSKQERENLIEQQEKYKKPTEAKEQKNISDNKEIVQLDNGYTMEKSQYDNMVNKREEYLSHLNKSIDSVKTSEWDIPIKIDGEELNIDLVIKHSDKERHSMATDASDLNAMANRRYSSDDGMDATKIMRDSWLLEPGNLEKLLSMAASQGMARGIERKISQDNNENFNHRPLQTGKTDDDGYGTLGD